MYVETKIINRIINIFNLLYKNILLQDVTLKNKKLIFWKIHRLHWEKNKFIFDLYTKRCILESSLVYNYFKD